MLDFRPGKGGCTTRCKWPYRKKGSVIVMYEVKSRCVETWFDGWEVRVRERQHVMGEITLSGVSHYGIRSMLSYVRSRQPLFEHRNPIPDYISRNDFEKFFFGDERDTYERLKRNRYGPSISSKRIVGIFPKDRTSFFPSKEPSSIFFPSDMIILSRRQNGKSAFLNRNPLLRDKPIDGHRRYSRIIIYRKFNVTSRWPLFPLARSSSRIDRLIQANPAVPINFYKASDKEI